MLQPLATLGALLAVAGCAPAPDAISATPEASAPLAIIECRQVPEDLCIENAESMIQGPQPDYASDVERVIVTCERLPPCEADRADSGGRIMILYDNGWAWSQDWAVMSGV